jgi:hypothetical protein
MKKLSIVIVGLVLIGTALFLLTRARATPVAGTPSHRCVKYLSSIGKGMLMYEMDHPGQSPTTFSELLNYFDSPKMFRCPVAGGALGSLTNVETWTS